MSFKLTQDAIDIDMEMSASSHAVLVVLCRFADDEGKNCYPTTETLAAKTRLHVRTVRGAIRDLEQLGLIAVSQRPGLVRRFDINTDMLKSAGGEDQDGGHKCAGGHKSDGGNNHAPDPGTKVTGTPAEKCPRREHIRNQLKEHTCMQADAPSDFNLESEKPAEPKRKALTHKFELDDLPTEWENYCRQVRPDIDAKKAFIEFRFYFTQGQGAEKRRSERGWNQAWQGWVRRQREEAQRPQNGPANGTRKIVFGSISESYARVLASKLARTQDQALTTYCRGCVTWDDAANRVADLLLTSERDFPALCRLLAKNKIISYEALP